MTAQTFATTHTLGIEPALPAVSTRLWTGRVLTGASALFFLMDAVMKLFKPPFVVEATVRLGYPGSTIVGIGLALLAAAILYLVPRTAILGALFLTGYLGGAVASNVRANTGWFNTVFPIVFASIAWAGLCLRDRRVATLLFCLRATIPFRRSCSICSRCNRRLIFGLTNDPPVLTARMAAITSFLGRFLTTYPRAPARRHRNTIGLVAVHAEHHDRGHRALP